MGDQASEVENLERIFTDTSAEPIKISYETIKYITKNFAVEIGDGGFGVVYLGGLQNGMVAVKKFFHWVDISDKQFLDEVMCLKKVNHRNIVRFLGYCADTEGEIMEVEGKYRIVEAQRKKLLCFEYVPNGNLHQYIKESTHGYEWNVRYKIIQGICQGLHYIHQQCINHLDLKPANVLLGANMEPKITDFGMSRFFSEEQHTMVTKNVFGTRGYIAPEFIEKQQISFKSDIFSLGVVMINILSGHNGCIPEKWHETIDAPCPQMKRCIEVAQRCVDADPHKRPTAGEIIRYLKETEIIIEKDHPTINEPRNDPGSSLHQVVQRFRALPIETLRKHSRVDNLLVELHVPECLLEGSKKPGRVPFQLLQCITENFSHKREIGRSGFTTLFRGVLQQRSVAVKKYRDVMDIDGGRLFHNEIKTMMLAQHKNILQFLGYCSNTEKEAVEYNGQLVMAEIEENLLCFEYLSNGSLDQYISDASCGLEWRLRYQIIKGICEGLHYLHGNYIVHMDLKPFNILLDDNMVPKIADFCVSRVFAEGQSQTVTEALIGTLGYWAPEFVHDRVVSYKSDIYSLGVVMTEILNGQKGYFPNDENLLESWKNRLLHTSSADLILLEQVRVCAEITRACIDDDPDKRPDTGRIIEMLLETETEMLLETETDGAGAQEDLLYMELNVIECILKGTKKPGILSHQLLLFITGNFSQEQEIGRSEFAITYRGILLNRRVAVKRLSTTKEFDDQRFSNVIDTLILVQHKNIVQFLGTCVYTQEEAMQYPGELIMPDTQERLLCFEYLSKGSLDNYISVASGGLQWRERYKIIMGICDGLHYLHGNRIVHGELRPTNVLLDDNMDPKLAYFCLSRCFVEHQRGAIKRNKIESMGYMAPEVFAGCNITLMSDIYSLGIIIAEMLTGCMDIAKENVLESWRTRMGTSLTDIHLEQVRVCTEISIACINPEPECRPDMQRIIKMLDETKCEEPAEQ